MSASTSRSVSPQDTTFLRKMNRTAEVSPHQPSRPRSISHLGEAGSSSQSALQQQFTPTARQPQWKGSRFNHQVFSPAESRAHSPPTAADSKPNLSLSRLYDDVRVPKFEDVDVNAPEIRDHGSKAVLGALRALQLKIQEMEADNDLQEKQHRQIVEHYKVQVEEMRRDQVQTQKQLQHYMKLIEGHRAEHSTMTDTIDSLRSQLEDAQSDKDSCQAQLDDLRKQTDQDNADATKRLSELQSAHDTLKEDAAREVQHLRQESETNVQDALEQKDDKARMIQASLESLTDELHRQQAARQELEAHRDQVGDFVEKLLVVNDELNAKLRASAQANGTGGGGKSSKPKAMSRRRKLKKKPKKHSDLYRRLWAAYAPSPVPFMSGSKPADKSFSVTAKIQTALGQQLDPAATTTLSGHSKKQRKKAKALSSASALHIPSAHVEHESFSSIHSAPPPLHQHHNNWVNTNDDDFDVSSHSLLGAMLNHSSSSYSVPRPPHLNQILPPSPQPSDLDDVIHDLEAEVREIQESYKLALRESSGEMNGGLKQLMQMLETKGGQLRALRKTKRSLDRHDSPHHSPQAEALYLKKLKSMRVLENFKKLWRNGGR